MKQVYFPAMIFAIVLCSFNPLPVQAADIPWQMFCHDMNHTCRSPYSGPAVPVVKWSYKTVGAIYSSPAVGADGTIYFGADDLGTGYGKIYALNSDGTLQWSYSTTGKVQSSPAIGADGRIYVGANNSQFYSMNPDGTVSFKKLTGGRIASSPAIDPDGRVYFGSDDNKLWVFEADGTLYWTYDADDDIASSPAISDDGKIYFGSFDGNVYALSHSGGLLWSFDTGDPVLSSPAVGADGTIYIGIGETDYYLLALYSDGTERWRAPAGAYVTSCPGIGADGTIYFGCHDGNLYAVNPDGSLRWTNWIASAMRSSPAIGADGTIHIGMYDGYIFAVTSDGEYKWKMSFGDEIYASPAIGPDGTLYVCSKDRFVYAIEHDVSAPTPTPMMTITSTGTPTPTSTTSPTPPWPDHTPPDVKIIQPEDGATLSGIVDIQIKATDESGIFLTEVQFNSGSWHDCTFSSTDNYWHCGWDTSGYAGQDVAIIARAADDSTSNNIGYSDKVTVSIEHIAPEVDIMSEFESYSVGDTIEIGVRVDNPSSDTIDMYAAILLGTKLYWYPMWAETPYPTVIEDELWIDLIASFTCVPEIPAGNYTFYAAITENMTYNLLDLDSVTITIN